MGYYVNPTNGQSKEAWLEENQIPPDPSGEEYRLVCLVDNGWMTAAAIGFCEREIEAFKDPSDRRPKQWYAIPLTKLLEICPELPLS